MRNRILQHLLIGRRRRNEVIGEVVLVDLLAVRQNRIGQRDFPYCRRYCAPRSSARKPGRSGFAAARIGRRQDRNEKQRQPDRLVELRAQAKKPKFASGLSEVKCHIDSATRVSPLPIRYLGAIWPDRNPTTGIISAIAIPPGISARPDRVAVY